MKRIFFGLITIIFVAIATSTVSVDSFVVDAQNNSSTKVLLQNRIDQLQQEINKYQKQINQTKSQKASLKNEISIYDNQIKSLELQLEANETQQEDAKLQINELQIQIDRRTEEIEENKKILAQLLVEFAKLDDDTFLQIGLGTDDFSSFLDQIQYTRSVQTQVYTLVSKIKEIKIKLETQQADLKQTLIKLESLKEELEISQASLAEQRADKEELLAQTQGVESNYQRLLSASQSAQADVLNELQELDNAARSGGSRSISVSGGVLGWPMDGILTQGYGNTGFTSLGYNFHNGIDIAAPAGKPIYAAADGVVANCDTGEAAYGNWCTIKHNISTNSGQRCIVTLYAHMRTFATGVGRQVKRGDLIGYEGNTGNTTRLLYGPERGYHLHFSVFDCEGYRVTPGKFSNVYGPYSVPSGYPYNPMSFLAK